MFAAAPAPVQLMEGEQTLGLRAILAELAQWHASQVVLDLGFGAALLLFVVVLTVVVVYRGGR